MEKDRMKSGLNLRLRLQVCVCIMHTCKRAN